MFSLFLIGAVFLGVMLSPINSSGTTGTAKTFIGTGLPIGKGRLAEFNGVSSVLYMNQSNGGVYAFFKDGSGETSSVLLPNFPSSGNYGCGDYVMTSKSEMWVLMGTGPVTAVQYQLSGSPLPTSATLVSSKTFGDSSSFCPSLIKLSDGGLVGVWTQNTAFNSTSGALGIVYRNPMGVWSQTFPYEVPYSTGGVHLTMAQHPVDNSIWVFTKQDGAQQINAYHMTATSNGIAVDWADTNFISQGLDGPNGPEGELPYIVAVGDKSHNAILLAYQDNQYKFFSPSLKGAHVTIAQINADKTRSYLVFPTYVERADYLGLVSWQGSVSLAYFPVNQTALTYDDAYFSSYSNGTWSLPTFLGTSYQSPPGLGYGINETQFAVDLSISPGNQLYLMGQSSSGITTSPPQSPTGLGATAISSSRINLSWTAPSSNGGSAVTGYKIERSNDGGTTWHVISSNTGNTSTSYSDTGLAKNNVYAYRVSAINSVGTSMPSNTALAKTFKNH